jgi:hypothetical protein
VSQCCQLNRQSSSRRDYCAPYMRNSLPSPQGKLTCSSFSSMQLRTLPKPHNDFTFRKNILCNGHCWKVAETHCSPFFLEYSFALDFVLRMDRWVAMLAGFSLRNGCKRTCLVSTSRIHLIKLSYL